HTQIQRLRRPRKSPTERLWGGHYCLALRPPRKGTRRAFEVAASTSSANARERSVSLLRRSSDMRSLSDGSLFCDSLALPSIRSIVIDRPTIALVARAR